MSKIGFIGLGIMDKPMSLHLAKGGHELFLLVRCTACRRTCLAAVFMIGMMVRLWTSDHASR